MAKKDVIKGLICYEDFNFVENENGKFTPEPVSGIVISDLSGVDTGVIDLSGDLVDLGNLAEIIGLKREEVRSVMENVGPNNIEKFI